MASKLLRRSGVAVGLVADVLGWRADQMFQVGIGHYHEEVDVLVQEWPGLEVHGCEPHPGILSEIKANGSYPGMVYPVALSDRPGTATLHVKTRHADGSSLNLHYDGSKTKMQSVAVDTMDRLFLPLVKPGRVLLWLDCEGSELKVLDGGEEFLKLVQVVNVEITGNPPGLGWCSPAEVHWKLDSRGFVRQWIHTQRIHEGQYDAIYVRPALFKRQFSCDPW